MTPSATIGIAVVVREDKVLIGRRPAGVPLAGFWEFPGGKVLPGESPAQAAVRECKEEAGLDVSAGPSWPSVEHDYPHGRVELHFFVCRQRDDRTPAPPYGWTPIGSLQAFDFPPANAEMIQRIIRGDWP